MATNGTVGNKWLQLVMLLPGKNTSLSSCPLFVDLKGSNLKHFTTQFSQE